MFVEQLLTLSWRLAQECVDSFARPITSSFQCCLFDMVPEQCTGVLRSINIRACVLLRNICRLPTAFPESSFPAWRVACGYMTYFRTAAVREMITRLALHQQNVCVPESATHSCATYAGQFHPRCISKRKTTFALCYRHSGLLCVACLAGKDQGPALAAAHSLPSQKPAR